MIWAGVEGKLDDIAIGDVRRFEADFLDHLRRHDKATLQAIADGTWDDDISAALDKSLKDFKANFLARGDDDVTVNEAPAEPTEGDLESESVTRYTDQQPAEKA